MMVRFRFTIQRLLLVVVISAELLMLCRIVGATTVTAAIVYLGSGWLTWVVCRGRRARACHLLKTTWAIWAVFNFIGLEILGVAEPMGLGLLFLLYPILFGAGLTVVITHRESDFLNCMPGVESALLLLTALTGIGVAGVISHIVRNLRP